MLVAARSCSEMLKAARSCSELLRAAQSSAAQSCSELLRAVQGCAELLRDAQSCPELLMKSWAQMACQNFSRGVPKLSAEIWPVVKTGPAGGAENFGGAQNIVKTHAFWSPKIGREKHHQENTCFLAVRNLGGTRIS